MKINFWQAVGIVLIIVGGIFFLRGKISKNQTIPPGGGNTPSALTQPAESGGDADSDADE